MWKCYIFPQKNLWIQHDPAIPAGYRSWVSSWGSRMTCPARRETRSTNRLPLPRTLQSLCFKASTCIKYFAIPKWSMILMILSHPHRFPALSSQEQLQLSEAKAGRPSAKGHVKPKMRYFLHPSSTFNIESSIVMGQWDVIHQQGCII